MLLYSGGEAKFQLGLVDLEFSLHLIFFTYEHECYFLKS